MVDGGIPSLLISKFIVFKFKICIYVPTFLKIYSIYYYTYSTGPILNFKSEC